MYRNHTGPFLTEKSSLSHCRDSSFNSLNPTAVKVKSCSFQRGWSLGWVPLSGAHTSAVPKNQHLFKWLSVTCISATVHLHKCKSLPLGQVAIWGNHLVKWPCITYRGAKAHWLKCIALPLIQVISLTDQWFFSLRKTSWSWYAIKTWDFNIEYEGDLEYFMEFGTSFSKLKNVRIAKNVVQV